MDLTVVPHPLSGTVEAVASKSVAHRQLILAALSDGITDITCNATSDDLETTMRCLTSLGASVARTRAGFRVVPLRIRGTKAQARLDAGESGSTLRFLLPVIGALGKGATIRRSERLAARPIAPLDEQLTGHGCALSTDDHHALVISGQLTAGTYKLPGNVSSQYASGLLMAAPLIKGNIAIVVREPVESKGYIDLTIQALDTFGIRVEQGRHTEESDAYRWYRLPARFSPHTPGSCFVEGDWSNAAFWLAAGALGGEGVVIQGLDARSHQGDRAIMAALSMMGARVGRGRGEVGCRYDHLIARDIDVSGIPDLVPPLAALAAMSHGTTHLTNAGRLRLKESDRLETVRDALVALGGQADIVGDGLKIVGVDALSGGTVDAANDHRIAMMATICAAYATGPTTIRGAQCVSKSYPRFFEDFQKLGGIIQESED